MDAHREGEIPEVAVAATKKFFFYGVIAVLWLHQRFLRVELQKVSVNVYVVCMFVGLYVYFLMYVLICFHSSRSTLAESWPKSGLPPRPEQLHGCRRVYL